MKFSSFAWLLVILIIVGAVGFWWTLPPQSAPATAGGPSTAMGTNGSPNQGNLGQPDNGQVQQPGDGTSVSENLALGLDSKASLGTYLIGYTGMTVYTYKNMTGTSTCYAQCATNWPPYTVPAGSTLNLQAGVSGKIATIRRADGSEQVTYNGLPLYFYIGDKTGSDTNGQGVGGVWYVVKP